MSGASTPPTETRAAVMRDYGTPLSIETVPLPSVLEPGSLIVRVACATLCGTDVHIWQGRFAPFGMELPIIPGHEMVGHVVALGPGDQRDAFGRPISVGDRIVWSESECGRCHACSVLREGVLCRERKLGFLQRADRPPYAIGALAEHAYVAPGSKRIVVGDDLDDRLCAAAGCAVKTVVRAYRRAGGITPGSTVVVQGSGSLGLVATAYARFAGAGCVITIGAPEARLSIASAWGADHVVSIEEKPSPEERVEHVLELTGGRGADITLDVAGARTVNREGVLMCAPRGCHIVVGVSEGEPDPLPMAAVMGKEITVVGSVNGDVGDLAAALAFLHRARDQVDWGLLFGTPVELAASTDTLVRMAAGQAVKPVVLPSAS